ncbi:MAG: FKBP-type peptidyl-prolyl cis-trans isomerase [Nocardioidaceae bacterium]|nr:FKBP-type peptidyl-prolyl cis-trans isomerase [Nocardioidaceae bacterium]
MTNGSSVSSSPCETTLGGLVVVVGGVSFHLISPSLNREVNFRVRRLVAGLVFPLLLLTAACGEEPPDPAPAAPKVATISDVTVAGPPDEKPTVDFKAPISFTATEGKVVEEGKGRGDAIEVDSTVKVHLVGVNASDGTELISTWEEGPASFAIDEVITGFGKGLEGTYAGDRVLLAVTSEDGYPNGDAKGTVRKGDSVVFVVDVLDVQNPLDVATGEEMAAPDAVPTLTYDDKQRPEKFTATETTPKTVDELGAYPIIKGDGSTVEAGQSLEVHYVGQIYPDGTVFDESWSSGEPASFSLDQVIPGWTQGLVGQTVGSRVVLVIPSELGYGAQGQGEEIPPDSDLIFSVDILAAY